VDKLRVGVPSPRPNLQFFQARVEDGAVCSGVHPDPTVAEAIAVAEAFERYALSLQTTATSNPELPTLERAAGVAIDYYRGLAGTSRAAYTAHFVSGSQSVSIPPAWVTFSGDPSVANSNGAALGSTLDDAIDAGMREVVERHHFMSCWLGLSDATMPGPADVPVLNALVRRTLGHDSKLEITWYILGTHGTWTTVLCVATSAFAPYLSMGAACRNDLGAAAEKALIEAATTRLLWTSRISQMGRAAFCVRGEELARASPIEIGLLEMGWIWASDRNAGARVQTCLTRYSGREPRQLHADEFMYCDISPPGLGMQKVVKVLHPHALPLPSCYDHLLRLADLVRTDRPDPIPFT
jgi:ribosomal protein S12 methylthiotransferase accessory factor YcaO